MSIAISVVLRPSKILRYCTIFFSFLLLSIGVYIGSLDHLSLLERSAFIAVCTFAAWLSFIYAQRHAKTQWHLNIDGKGQLHCQADSSAESRPFKLVTGTTLWAQALFLRLHNSEDNLQMNLVILPDALSKDEFRRLLVACKWIIART